MIFERYKSIIEDWDAFTDACRAPLPTCIWTNNLRTSADIMQQKLERSGIRFAAVKWCPGAFRLSPDFTSGASLEYLTGLYHVQEEVAMLPVELLRPKAGDLVLDLCAAPGNKTAQMAVMMQNHGTIIANEINGHRMQPLRQVINRLGLVNVTTTIGDATAFPNQPIRFDCVMADVVCSCEGTSRKNPEILTARDADYSNRLQRSQVAILKRALQLCKTGGLVAYATCTYAPEENEMVVQKALEALSTKIPARLVGERIPGLLGSPGLGSWRGERFRTDMTNAIRIYPHQNNTGGFFVAIIEKLDDLRRNPPNQMHPATHPERIKPLEAAPLLEFVEQRFGIAKSIWAEFQIFRSNSKIASVIRPGHYRIQKPEPASIGLPSIHINMKYPKLTTAAAMFFGRYCRKNVLSLNSEQAIAFFKGEDFDAEPSQIRGYDGPGYVIIEVDGMFAGTAIFFERMHGGIVRGQFPKAWQRDVSRGRLEA